MTGTRSPRRTQTATLQPRIKVWLESDGGSGFCNGMCLILKAVERTSSIKQAAAELGKSYRYVWGRIKDAERVVGKQLVETQIGGKASQRSRLTPFAKQLAADLLALRDEMKTFLEREFARRFC